MSTSSQPSGKPMVVIAYRLEAAERAVAEHVLGDVATIVHLGEVAEGERAGMLGAAAAVLARNTAKDLQPGEAVQLRRARLLQFVTAGVDFVPLGAFSPDLPIAANGGGYAEPMAEHALAMSLAAAKRLLNEHRKLAQGTFDQFAPNRMLAGRTCGILGFGGIGVATARLTRAVGMRVHAINRRGASAEPLDWIGTPDRLPELLRAADVLIIAVPLTKATQGMLGAAELAMLPRDAILVNLARGEIVDEAALYAHLLANPAFTACIDAWWIEPVRHGRFTMGHPFMELPNVIGSPHNSASAAGWRPIALQRALSNIRRAMIGEPVQHLVGMADRMM